MFNVNQVTLLPPHCYQKRRSPKKPIMTFSNTNTDIYVEPKSQPKLKIPQQQEAPKNCSPAEFLKAARAGDSAMVKLLIDAGIDVDSKNALGYTGLIASCERGYLDVATILIESGSDRDIKDNSGMTAEDWAVKKGHVSVIGMLDATRGRVYPRVAPSRATQWKTPMMTPPAVVPTVPVPTLMLDRDGKPMLVLVPAAAEPELDGSGRKANHNLGIALGDNVKLRYKHKSPHGISKHGKKNSYPGFPSNLPPHAMSAPPLVYQAPQAVWSFEAIAARILESEREEEEAEAAASAAAAAAATIAR